MAAKKERRRFYVPGAVAVPGKSDTQGRRRFFTVPPVQRWEAECELHQRYGLPPREVCEDCGARAHVEPQEAGTWIVSELHAPDCYYQFWPTRVFVDGWHEGDPWPLRPTVARGLSLPVTRCGVCRAPVLGDVEYDRKTHQ